MVILNTPISRPPSALFERLWTSSRFHICADGGANRLYEATQDSQSDFLLEKYVPNAIRGDLDSLHDHVRDYYASKQVLIEKDPSQDTNDLDKALQKIVSVREFKADDEPSALPSSITLPYDQVIIYGGFGGRFDQEMASIQALYKWADTFQNRLWLYSDETSAVLIPAGKVVELAVPFQGHHAIREGPMCGLIPMGAKCESITTSGFQWNLEDSEMEFGGLVSTSNSILGNTDGVVTIETSNPIIFTAEIVCQTKASQPAT